MHIMASYHHHEYKPHVLSLTNSNMRFTIEFLVTFYNNASMFPSATPTLATRLLRTCNCMAAAAANAAPLLLFNHANFTK